MTSPSPDPQGDTDRILEGNYHSQSTIRLSRLAGRALRFEDPGSYITQENCWSEEWVWVEVHCSSHQPSSHGL